MITCPFCARPAMTHWEKLLTRPRHGRPCAACGRTVNLALGWMALALVVPMTLGGTVAHVSRSLPFGAAAILIATAAAVLLYLYAVPLVPHRADRY